MSLDFKAIKQIRITDVCAKYGIALRFQGDWGSAKCPLPTHKAGDKDKTFQVNLSGNYWKCWSASCNEKAGKKGGDVINLVALLDNCSEYNAAKKLSEMFHTENKTAPHMETRWEQPSKGQPQKHSPDHIPVSDSVKGYMADVDGWFDELFRRGEKETDVEFWKRTRNGVKARLIESFKNGKRQAQSLPAQ